VPLGVIGVIDLNLSASATAAAGAGFALSSVSFALNRVPAPGTLALSLAALGLITPLRRRSPG
jgi:hypothetical protein